MLKPEFFLILIWGQLNPQRLIITLECLTCFDGSFLYSNDVSSASFVKSDGVSTFAVYPNENEKAFKQIERLRKDGRGDMYAEANYREGGCTKMTHK